MHWHVGSYLRDGRRLPHATYCTHLRYTGTRPSTASLPLFTFPTLPALLLALAGSSPSVLLPCHFRGLHPAAATVDKTPGSRPLLTHAGILPVTPIPGNLSSVPFYLQQTNPSAPTSSSGWHCCAPLQPATPFPSHLGACPDITGGSTTTCLALHLPACTHHLPGLPAFTTTSPPLLLMCTTSLHCCHLHFTAHTCRTSTHPTTPTTRTHTPPACLAGAGGHARCGCGSAPSLAG